MNINPLSTSPQPSNNASNSAPFDRLPDEIMLLILDKLTAFRDLMSMKSTCQRFHGLVMGGRRYVHLLCASEALHRGHALSQTLGNLTFHQPLLIEMASVDSDRALSIINAAAQFNPSSVDPRTYATIFKNIWPKHVHNQGTPEAKNIGAMVPISSAASPVRRIRDIVCSLLLFHEFRAGHGQQLFRDNELCQEFAPILLTSDCSVEQNGGWQLLVKAAAISPMIVNHINHRTATLLASHPPGAPPHNSLQAGGQLHSKISKCAHSTPENIWEGFRRSVDFLLQEGPGGRERAMGFYRIAWVHQDAMHGDTVQR